MAELAWLVEVAAPTRYWTGRSQSDLTDYHEDAMRFARKVDAQHAIDWIVELRLAEKCQAVEHMWL